MSVARIKLKRAYDAAQPSDGYRVLVERLWPRGVRKDTLPLAEWLKDIAPSTELRQWFGHEPERWVEFGKRYRQELKISTAAPLLLALAQRARRGAITLVFSSRDAEHNNAVVLQEVLGRMTRDGAKKANARAQVTKKTPARPRRRRLSVAKRAR